jgi:hypothetical protein
MRIPWLLLILSVFLSGCSMFENGHLIRVNSKTAQGFNYPYFLFIPSSSSKAEKQIIIVEPNNTGTADDSFEVHEAIAKILATDADHIGNYVSRKLHYPLLVPVFPRPMQYWQVYTHALDRDVQLQRGTDLERIDLQLLSMISDAQSTLTKMGFQVHDKILMTGFSASGTFVNRFSAIHPGNILEFD